MNGGEDIVFSSAAGGEDAGILCYVVGEEFGGFVMGQDFGAGFGQSAVLEDGEGELVSALIVIGGGGFCEDGFCGIDSHGLLLSGICWLGGD